MDADKSTEDQLIDWQLLLDLRFFGQSYEYLIDGKRYRLDPRFVKRTFITDQIKGGKPPFETNVDMNKVIIKNPIMISEHKSKED